MWDDIIDAFQKAIFFNDKGSWFVIGAFFIILFFKFIISESSYIQELKYNHAERLQNDREYYKKWNRRGIIMIFISIIGMVLYFAFRDI